MVLASSARLRLPPSDTVNSVTMGKLINLSVPQIPHQLNGIMDVPTPEGCSED